MARSGKPRESRKRDTVSRKRTPAYSIQQGERAAFSPIPATPPAPQTRAPGFRVKLQGDASLEDMALLTALTAVTGETCGAILARGLHLVLERLPKPERESVAAVQAAELTKQRAKKRRR